MASGFASYNFVNDPQFQEYLNKLEFVGQQSDQQLLKVRNVIRIKKLILQKRPERNITNDSLYYLHHTILELTNSGSLIR